MLRLVYLAFVYCWYDGSLLDLWPFKILSIIRRRCGARRRKPLHIAPTSEVAEPLDQDFPGPFSPLLEGESYPASSPAGVASVRDVEDATLVSGPGTSGVDDEFAPASNVPLAESISPSGSIYGSAGSEISELARTEGRRGGNERDDNDLKRSVIAAKLTPLVVLASFVSDLDVVADWVFFNEGLGGEGQLIYYTALVFAVFGTIMYVLVTVEFHLVSKARAWWEGRPLGPLEHISLGWQLGINVIVEDIPQLVITCVTSPTSTAGVLNITTAAFALLAKMTEAFATPMSSQLRMIEADPRVVRYVTEQRRNAEELADKAGRIVDLVNRFRKEPDGSKRQAAIAFYVMQTDSSFLDGELDCVREKLLAPTMELDNLRVKGPIPSSLGSLTQLTKLTLSMNRLNGNIPLELGSLRALTTLDLGDNDFTGRIPYTLGNLTKLRFLIIRDNKLRGPIPSSLGNLKQLVKLDIGGNGRVRGHIPSALFGLTALRVLDLSDNQLSGPIPSGLGGLPALWALRLHDNRFVGPIPAALGGLAALRTLRLASNKLTGPIPDLRQTSLQTASFYDNKFDGDKADAQRHLPEGCIVEWNNAKG
ncbi:unnamed protein product [Scytosiphon promiscuus]